MRERENVYFSFLGYFPGRSLRSEEVEAACYGCPYESDCIGEPYHATLPCQVEHTFNRVCSFVDGNFDVTIYSGDKDSECILLVVNDAGEWGEAGVVYMAPAELMEELEERGFNLIHLCGAKTPQ